MHKTISLESTNSFSKTFLAYLSGNPSLEEFYHLKPSLDNFQQQIESKDFPTLNRKTLVNVLEDQNKNLTTSKETQSNIEALLLPTTFTITTGHQLNLFGGPLYFIYKIITTVNTAKELSKKYNDYNFVPVFWMASEDHDFEEINNFNLFGKNWNWESLQNGAVGRFNTEGLNELITSLPEKIALFEKAYLEHKTLSEATRYFVNELFGSDGLVIVDADNRELKQLFSGTIKEEIISNNSFALVNKTSALLDEKGFDTQVHAREINIFYLENNLRERIVREGDNYKINNTELVFTEAQLLSEIDTNPENFSPNVILRPLYQETILPNLAYIGGPAEIIYWLQFKAVFDHYKIAFPILIPRNFVLYLNKGASAKLDKLSLKIEDLFTTEEKLKNDYLIKISGGEFKLTEEQEEIKKIFSSIKEKAGLIDKTMEAPVMAELQKSLKILDELEKRLRKADERKNETVITQLLSLKAKLFPNNGLQERHDNFLSFFINDPKFIQTIKETIDPFNFTFYIISENE